MDEKQLAGEYAIEFVTDGMVVGLGTGSTVKYTIEGLGRRVKAGLRIKAVSTSKATTTLAESLGIDMLAIDDVDYIDVTIDGADEVDASFNGIKGGGGALLFEKIVATASKRVVWVVDSSKVVERIGRFPLPVEVIRFGYTHVFRRLAEAGMHPVLRLVDDEIFTTDSGNYIIDLHLNEINRPDELELRLKSIPGVVETGLFLGIVDDVVVGSKDTVKILHNSR